MRQAPSQPHVFAAESVAVGDRERLKACWRSSARRESRPQRRPAGYVTLF